jgi:hypothetical protein
MGSKPERGETREARLDRNAREPGREAATPKR